MAKENILGKKIITLLEKHLANTFPENYKKYEEMFSVMTDEEIKTFFLKKNGRVRLYVDDDKSSQANIDKLVDSLGVKLEEKLKLPYKGNATTKHKILGFPIQILKLQQMSTKENASTLDTSVRDVNNQATRESKTGLLSDAEVAQIAVYGDDSEPIVRELFSPRGDNKITKQAMNEKISTDLDFSLADLPDGSNGRISLLHLDANYVGMGFATDLIEHIDARSGK